jgi:hypothetical protein
MRFVNPRSEFGVFRELPARFFHGQRKHVHAERKIRRRQHADARLLRHVAKCSFMRLPAGGANHHVDFALRQLRQIPGHRIGEREVNRHIDVAKLSLRNCSFARVLVDHTCNRGVVR